MITVTIQKDASGEYKGFSVIGHAGFAKKGSDVVCAAVSMLVINTYNSIEVLTGDGHLLDLVQNEEEGLIECRFTGTISQESRLLIDAMVLGLEGVQKQYSKKYIRLIVEEV